MGIPGQVAMTPPIELPDSSKLTFKPWVLHIRASLVQALTIFDTFSGSIFFHRGAR
jgi:hypothetical protein